MAGNSGRTAISRAKPSAPARWLTKMGLVPMGLDGPTVLDWGCGKGTDMAAYGWQGWDPNHRPAKPEGPFMGWPYIVSNYVANVLDEEERQSLYLEILEDLAWDGEAYISVRRDKPESESGFTGIGTFQDFGVRVDQEAPEAVRAELVREVSGSYALYRLTHANNPEG